MDTEVAERVSLEIYVENDGNVLTTAMNSKLINLKANVYPQPSNQNDLRVKVYGKSSTQGEYFIKISLEIITKTIKRITVGEAEVKVAVNITWKNIASFEIQGDLNQAHWYMLGNKNVLKLSFIAGVVDLSMIKEERREIAGSAKFLSDMENLMRDQDSCDAILCTEGREFPVHKGVMCARSQSFARMFETNMLERHTNTVLVEGVTASALEEIICFLYTGKVRTAQTDILLEMYVASIKYSLCDLRKEAGHLLMKSNFAIVRVGVLIVRLLESLNLIQ